MDGRNASRWYAFDGGECTASVVRLPCDLRAVCPLALNRRAEHTGESTTLRPTFDLRIARFAQRGHSWPRGWMSRLGACAQEAGRFDIRPGLSESQSAARTPAAPSFNPRRRSRSRAAFPDTDVQTWKDVGRTHTKTVVVVSVVRVVPVAVGATHVVCVVVERAAAQHARLIGRALHDEPCGSDMTFSEVLSHPPSKRPISATIPDAWRYCADVIHCQRWHRRR
ncbi:MAG: hypothetical protein KatS3mg053_0326 [Candidatus Roseilinea sp.]|nr:MAG: hypothetical protein KatS3mg053_0326 [Candidatus Roseilinea sp.]